jgi:hypothetical protein
MDRGQRILVLGNHLAGAYYTFAPELAQQAQGLLAQLSRQILPDGDPGPFGGATQSSATENTTKRLTNEEIYESHLADLEDGADKLSNPIARKLAYVKAALAAKPEDYQRAKRIAEKIDDDDLRADAVSFVLYRAALFFVEKGEIEKAAEIAPKINAVLRRAIVNISITQHLLERRTAKSDPAQLSFDQQRALDLLSEIEGDLRKEDPSAKVVKIMLGETAVLAKIDKARALVSLGQAVQMINKLDRFDLKDGAAPDLSLGVSAVSGATVARPRTGFDFRSAIAPLITTDFEEVSAIAERLTAKELNGIGRLEVAKLYLTKKSDSSLKVSSSLVR